MREGASEELFFSEVGPAITMHSDKNLEVMQEIIEMT